MHQIHPEGKFVVTIDKDIDMAKLTAGTRVALRNDSYELCKILPSKVCFVCMLECMFLSPRFFLLYFGTAGRPVGELDESREGTGRHVRDGRRSG